EAVPPPGRVPAAAIPAGNDGGLPTRPPARAVLPRLLLGDHAGGLRRRGGEPLVDGRADGADGVRENRSRGPARRAAYRARAHRPWDPHARRAGRAALDPGLVLASATAFNSWRGWDRLNMAFDPVANC